VQQHSVVQVKAPFLVVARLVGRSPSMNASVNFSLTLSEHKQPAWALYRDMQSSCYSFEGSAERAGVLRGRSKRHHALAIIFEYWVSSLVQQLPSLGHHTLCTPLLLPLAALPHP
jgi:hypothetical protein